VQLIRSSQTLTRTARSSSSARTSRRTRRLAASFALLGGLVSPVVVLSALSPAGATGNPPCGAAVASGSGQIVTCNYSGADQSWTVPPTVTRATFAVSGAQGGSFQLISGGLGGTSTGLFSVTPGRTYTVVVGGTAGGSDPCGTPLNGGFGGGGTGGSGTPCSGGGGGGGSWVYDGTTPLVVAGGGGGEGGCGGPAGYAFGGGGGGLSGAEGNNCSTGLASAPGTQTAGGTGTGGATSGSSGHGGNGGNASGSVTVGGGGGGGGWYGGAGGAGYTGGGGGSGYVASSAITSSLKTGMQSGNGIVTITYAGPVVTKVSPALGVIAGGSLVTIRGVDLSSATTVLFGSVAGRKLTVVSPTELTVKSPPQSFVGIGTVDVLVKEPSGTSGRFAADRFTYLAPPTMTSLTPGSGPTTGRTLATLVGSNFQDVLSVTFGTAKATVVSINASHTKMTVKTPAHASGYVTVTVSTLAGSQGVTAAFDYL